MSETHLYRYGSILEIIADTCQDNLNNILADRQKHNLNTEHHLKYKKHESCKSTITPRTVSKPSNLYTVLVITDHPLKKKDHFARIQHV